MDQAANDQQLGLEAAAWANLEDLDAWRVYADWLLDSGDPRGELANLAVAAGTAFLSERRTMAKRVAQLERPFIDAWHVWAQDHDLLDVKVVFKRGFAHAIEGDLIQLLPHLDALWERDPIQRLTLTHVDPDSLAQLLDRPAPWLARLRYLKLVGDVGETGAAALASVALSQLRRLNLIQAGIDDDGCRHLAQLQAPKLEHLTLTGNEIGDAGLASLLTSPTRGSWKSLYMASTGLGNDGIAGLCATPGLDGLEGLFLRQIEASITAFAPLASAAVLPGLRTLELSPFGYWMADLRPVHEALRARFGDRLRLR